jgi:O-antigen ligase
MGALWLYTVLRFALFGALFGILWLIGVRGFLGAILALVLSFPLSLVLLARPRAALSDTIEQRLAARRRREEDLDAQLRGDEEPP